MHNLEPSGLVAPHSCCTADIPRLSLKCSIFEDNIGRLKDLDRQRVRAVLADGLEEALEQRGAHYLKLERLGIGDAHGEVAGVFPVEELEVLLM